MNLSVASHSSLTQIILIFKNGLTEKCPQSYRGIAESSGSKALWKVMELMCPS